MSPHIFFTGATGYIGGTALALLVRTLPSTSITALVRTQEAANLLQKAHPNVHPVIGDLDSHDLLVSEAAKADLVLHCANADHAVGTYSLVDGLISQKHRSEKGAFVHLSGAASVVDFATCHESIINPNTRVYSDIDDAEEIFNLPHDRAHVAIERTLTARAEAAGVKTVILSPANVFGIGTGTGNIATFTEEYPRAVLKLGHAFQVGDGQGTWSWSSVHDVARAIVFVAEEALQGTTAGGGGGGGGKLEFGKAAYYYIESGDATFADQAELVASELASLGASLTTREVLSIDAEAATKLHKYGVLLWGGCGARSRADKLRAMGWKAEDRDWRPFWREVTRKVFEEWRMGDFNAGGD